MLIRINPESILCIGATIHSIIRDPSLSLHQKREKTLSKISQVSEHWEGPAERAYEELAREFVNSNAFPQKSDDELEHLLVQPLRKAAQSICITEESLRRDFSAYGIF
jgi:uncharacterized protein YukE